MVYSATSRAPPTGSLGTLMILDHISRARRMGLLTSISAMGARSRKMDYKSRSCRRTPDGGGLGQGRELILGGPAGRPCL